MPELEIWTDGSHGKHDNGGWAYVITLPYNWFVYIEDSGAVRQTTSQRMELTALVKAMERVNELNLQGSFAIHTDSSYLKNCFTQKWMTKWIMNGWVNSAGKPVANKDLWLELAALLDNRVLRWKKVKGHKGIELNERCDTLAKAARASLL